MPDMKPVRSSNITAVGWSAETGLVIVFTSGATYHYPEAPEAMAEGIRLAASPGSFASRFVYPFYDGERQ